MSNNGRDKYLPSHVFIRARQDNIYIYMPAFRSVATTGIQHLRDKTTAANADDYHDKTSWLLEHTGHCICIQGIESTE